MANLFIVEKVEYKKIVFHINTALKETGRMFLGSKKIRIN